MTEIDEQTGGAVAVAKATAATATVAAPATDVEGEPRKLPYPKSVGFIISNEFCERFCYYGMRTILVLYLTRKLAYDDDTATIIYHVFTMLVYFMCTFGAILSDSWLGKFNTILYLSIVYACGSVIIALGAIPTLNLPGQTMTLIGLALIALGSGGIKPCVAAFGGDQFEMPAQAAQMATYFSLFYFAINAGSLISTSVTPLLRQDVKCFGSDDCYSLAFGVPGVLMVVSIFVFVFGKFLYKITPPAGNMVVLVSKCIGNAISTRWRESKFNKRSHWLQYAEPVYGKQLVHDTRVLLNVLVLFIPLPFFWALFDQQGSRWTFQATRMNGDLGFYTILPDQMQVINPLLILVFIPLYDWLFYPLLSKVGIRRPLQKLTLGGIFAGVAFLASGLVEMQLEASTYPVLPNAGSAQLRLYNTLPCNYTVHTSLPEHLEFQLGALDAYQAHVPFVGYFEYRLAPAAPSGTGGVACPAIQGQFELHESTASGYYIRGDALVAFDDSPAQSRSGDPALRVLANVPVDKVITVVDLQRDGTVRHREPAANVSRIEVAQSKQLEVRVNDERVTEIDLRLGAVAALVLTQGTNGAYHTGLVYVTKENSLNMLWQLPQYVIMTLGEVMFSVTGLAFSYAQAPVSMKSALQACWLLTVAFGNVIDIIIVGAKAFDSQAHEFFLFAGLMFIDMLLFMWLAHRYTPLGVVNFETESTEAIVDADSKKELAGIENVAFVKDQQTTSG